MENKEIEKAPELTPGIIACRDFFKNIEEMYANYLKSEGEESDRFEFLFFEKGKKIRLEFEVVEEFPTMFIHKLRQERNLFGCKLTSVDWDDEATVAFAERLGGAERQLKQALSKIEAIKADIINRGGSGIGFKADKI